MMKHMSVTYALSGCAKKGRTPLLGHRCQNWYNLSHVVRRHQAQLEGIIQKAVTVKSIKILKGKD